MSHDIMRLADNARGRNLNFQLIISEKIPVLRIFKVTNPLRIR